MPMILLIVLAIGPVAQSPAGGTTPPSYQVMNGLPGENPLPRFALYQFMAVRDELKWTPDQEKKREEILEKFTQNRQATIQRAVDREKARADFLKLRDALEAEVEALLTPEQKGRFDQIEFQIQGPYAFTREELPNRLGLTDPTLGKVRAIAAEGQAAMEKASLARLPLPAGATPRSLEDVSELVKSRDFRAAKEDAWTGVFEARRKTLERIEQALDDRQREAYRKLVGRPFDVEALWVELAPKEIGPEIEIARVALELGFTTGQRADPNFDTKVPNPAYAGARHPTILFDEAHHNFHTSGGRYKAFAELAAHDGYKVVPNHQPFTGSSLAGSDILVIANAMGAERMNNPDSANSAFTEAESDAVRDWVVAGGSLLLITDHQPFGDAAESLAKRFGVDMSKGVTTDPVNDGERGLLFAREKGLIGDHAITRGRDDSERVDRVLTFTGQSLQGPAGSVPFLIFSKTAVDQRGGDPIPAAGRAQGIAFAHGKGRVVVMGEAAQLSAQVYGFPPVPMGMNVSGSDNRKMALNTLHWLSRLID